MTSNPGTLARDERYVKARETVAARFKAATQEAKATPLVPAAFVAYIPNSGLSIDRANQIAVTLVIEPEHIQIRDLIMRVGYPLAVTIDIIDVEGIDPLA